MKKNNLLLIAFAIGIILFIIAYSKVDLKVVLKNFSGFNPIILCAYALVVILMDILVTLRWKMILNIHKISLPFARLFFYNMSGYAIGFLTSQTYFGGEPVRVMLLNASGVDPKKGLSYCLLDKFMQVTTDLLFCMIAVIILILHFSFPRKIEFFLVLAILLPAALIYIYYTRMIRHKPFFSAITEIPFLKRARNLNSLRSYLLEIDKTTQNLLTRHKNYFMSLFLINLANVILVVTEYTLLLAMFSIKITPFSVLLVLFSVTIPYSIPVPLALGILEFSESLVTGILGLNKEMGISIALLIRFKDIIRSVVGLASLFYFGARNSIVVIKK